MGLIVCPPRPVPVERGTPGTITGCGAVIPDVRDDEGWVDCPNCGLGFNPEHPENQP